MTNVNCLSQSPDSKWQEYFCHVQFRHHLFQKYSSGKPSLRNNEYIFAEVGAGSAIIGEKFAYLSGRCDSPAAVAYNGLFSGCHNLLYYLFTAIPRRHTDADLKNTNSAIEQRSNDNLSLPTLSSEQKRFLTVTKVWYQPSIIPHMSISGICSLIHYI